ncbi:SUMO1 sentrin specific peptidase 1 [Desmophyllum pertusum]|uniref:SUMO1 sentrin specific peptidase 1 n=1 Tax=Desmophyllum pertusum TaxID=174260 RepID=A0A9X0A0V3_9CNID|nr:SUMO1 sentrin specific peptidase 1 [Desmophyllum pertusum]
MVDKTSFDEIKAVVSSKQPKESNLIAKDGIPITYFSLEDLRRCTGDEGDGWLSCFVINRYIQQIIDAYTNGGGIYKLGLLTSNKFHSAKTKPSALKRVAKYLYKVINLKDQEFCYLDSLGVGARGLEYIRLGKQLLSSVPLPGQNCENWTVKLSQDSFDIPLQTNLSNCGVYVCLYALCILRGNGMEFEAEDVGALRCQMEIKEENCIFLGPDFSQLSEPTGFP